MNTNLLKKFAQDARKKLLEQVGAKLSFVLTTDSVELREKADQVSQLREELSRTGKAQLIEKVAYTWFNRLMALRFMDANDYQPLGIRVITPKDGYTTSELLDEAKRGNIPDELKLKRQKVYDLLDNRIPSTNPQNEAYKELLIAACNHLNTVFPFLFEKISDYTELLIPDDLTSDFSIVTDVREGMAIEDCANVEIIGWLYQFYISEKKDEVFASKSAVKKEDIPAATQLFTPRWIVEYMVQNTVGKLWLQNRPKSKLREYMPYFIESATMKSGDFLKVSSPEEIRLLDPASGSGHILVYAFDLFTKIYEEEGYSTNDIPKLIIEKNLNGFEIDERAAQLSGLALMMKAREYNRRAFKKDLQPNILCFQDLQLSKTEIKETFHTLQVKISDALLHDLINMQQATNFGSLILPLANLSEMVNFHERLNQIKSSGDLFQNNAIDALQFAISQLIKLVPKFHCVVANPPYMGNGNMNKELSEFVKANYPDSKSDLMACFMESGLDMLLHKGFLGMINQHSWMFLSSYEGLRKKLIINTFFDTLLHLGARTFPEIGGEIVQNTAFTFWNNQLEGKGCFFRLVDENTSELKRTKTIEAIENNDCGWFYKSCQNDYSRIPSFRIGYWISEKGLQTFEKSIPIGEKGIARRGLQPAIPDKFKRRWFEVSSFKTQTSYKDRDDSIKDNFRWYYYNDGGDNLRWYGTLNYVIDWENNGERIKNVEKAIIPNEKLYFNEGITWSKISSGAVKARYLKKGIISGDAAPFFLSDSPYLYIGFFNSKVTIEILKLLSATVNLTTGNVEEIPFPEISSEQSLHIENLSKICVTISEFDWNMREISWEFKQNEFLRIKGEDIEETFELYQQYWKNKFFQLHNNEEELSRQFIEIYGLQEELTQVILLADITILKEELFSRKQKSKNDEDESQANLSPIWKDLEKQFRNNLFANIELPFAPREVFAQFMSYAVGCMFGRYSLDKDGLVLANTGETLQDYLNKIEKLASECLFLPDEDNIIPVLDDEWFEDDITGRFYQFLKVSFGEKNFNKNLAFIEEQLGKDIRKYFTKDFYPDHIKRYKKRPIYWMFSSAKGSFNVLIYLHRYTPDTVSNILNKYLKEFIGKLKTRKETLQHIQVNGSSSEKTKAIKENDSIDKMLIELHEYERDVLFPLATERIAIDLDDGVLVNYNKFGKAVKEVTGLNDKATKKKVMEFDWIDATQIR